MFYGSYLSKFGKTPRSVKMSRIGIVWSVEGCHCIWLGYRMSGKIRERGTSYLLIKWPSHYNVQALRNVLQNSPYAQLSPPWKAMFRCSFLSPTYDFIRKVILVPHRISKERGEFKLSNRSSQFATRSCDLKIFTFLVFSATINIRKILTYIFPWSDMSRCNDE